MAKAKAEPVLHARAVYVVKNCDRHCKYCRRFLLALGGCPGVKKGRDNRSPICFQRLRKEERT